MRAKYSLGIDIGSVSVKLVLLDQDRIVDSVYRRFCGGPFETLTAILAERQAQWLSGEVNLGLTGIGGKTAQSILGGMFFGEIASLAAGNFLLAPHVRTVIEMGGEDSKLLLLNPENGVVDDFAMNAQCAAGTGSFLDQQAGRLNISIEDEFGHLALKSKRPPRIAGRCSVFAKSDMIHLQQVATPDYDIVAGLCFAVARNFKSSIARGKKFVPPVAFEGGVAANPGMVRAFREILELDAEDLIVPEHFNVMAAAGAARLAAVEGCGVTAIDSEAIRQYQSNRQAPLSTRAALSFDFPDQKFYETTQAAMPGDIDGREVFLGIDIGSLSTNLVLIDQAQQVVARRYLMTEGRPIEAVRRGLAEIGAEVGDRVKVVAAGTTGSGRYLIGDFVGADIVRNEITAQATAAVNIDPGVDTIFEIGGQDSKYISIRNKTVIDFEMNKACAAGTGSFLQEQAEKLQIQIENEFGERALSASCPVGCGERCTVFMESDLVSHQRSGATKDDLLAGLAYSIVSNYLTKVVGDRKIGDHIFFQGGVAWNQAVVAAFEKMTGKAVTVPPHHDVTGAIGAAILAKERHSAGDLTSKFRGFDLHQRKYNVESFGCEDCSNQCEIHKVEVEGEEPLYYGSRCEKYDVGGQIDNDGHPDYVKIRQKLLYKRYLTFKRPDVPRGRVGLPRVLHFHEYFPFWQAFFEALGFKVVNSDVSDRPITEAALELFAAETCYPIKLVYGHIANLLAKDVDFIFLPSLIKVPDDDADNPSDSYICPWVQAIGSSIQSRFDFDKHRAELITTPIRLAFSQNELESNLRKLGPALGLTGRELNRAIRAGSRAYGMYKKELHEQGRRILDSLAPDEQAMVIVSRPYNGYDPKLSMELPDKVRNLGVKAIPVDFLTLCGGETDFPYMYWRYGRRILSAAEAIRRHPNLFAIYITSFGCGPDSFISHFFRKEMSGKPYLQLELDEHSADAGLITRCEAFVDSLRFYRFTPPIADFSLAESHLDPKGKTIFIPNMCDHAYGIRAAMAKYGLTVEVMDEPDEETLEYGKKFTSGKECFPCQITTGDVIKYLKRKDFDRSRAVFFMPGANGPCRFGLYSQYHRLVLDDLGYTDVPILSPNSKSGYTEFGLDSGFRLLAWRAMTFIDGLTKLLLRVRPYETTRGEAEKTYFSYIGKLDHAVVNEESLESLARQAGEVFAAIPVAGEAKPLVGVVGEIYLRNNRFSNNHLITKLEKLGLEVRLATFCEWPMYTSAEFRRDSFLKRDWRGLLAGQLQISVQHRHEKRLMDSFSRHFPLGHEWSVERVLREAARYIPRDCKGEALLSIGKGVEMVRDGAAGMVNAMPFNCMPGTIVSGLSKQISEDLGGVPWLNISYEGLRDSGEDTRLEAFADQVVSFDGRRTSAAPSNRLLPPALSRPV
ncbi:MAG: acyl-CoA dehydratase activase [bacterium]